MENGMNQRDIDSGLFVPQLMKGYEDIAGSGTPKNLEGVPEITFEEENGVETKTNAGLPAVAIAAQFADSSGGGNKAVDTVTLKGAGIDKDSQGFMVFPVAVKQAKPATKSVAVSRNFSANEINDMLSVAGDYVGSAEGTINDTRININERRKLRFGEFDEKKDSYFGGGTGILISEAGKFIGKLRRAQKDAGQTLRFENLERRLADIKVFNDTYLDMMSARMMGNGDKLASYISPMNLRFNESVDKDGKDIVDDSGRRTPNRLRLQAKVCALNRLKYLADENPNSVYAETFGNYTSVEKESWSGKILQNIERELIVLDDWELIGQFKKIMGRLPADSVSCRAKTKSEPKIKIVEVPKKESWFRKGLTAAAAFVIGAVGGIAYDASVGLEAVKKFYMPEKQETRIVEPVETKSGYSLDLNGFMSERMPKRTCNSLSLEDVAESNERDYSQLRLW